MRINKLEIKYLNYTKLLSHDYVVSEWPDNLTAIWAGLMEKSVKLSLEQIIKTIETFKNYMPIYNCKNCNTILVLGGGNLKMLFNNRIYISDLTDKLRINNINGMILSNDFFKLSCQDLIIKKLLE